jgi:hypothetical protein
MADFDLSQLQGLLSQFGPTEEEKRQAKMQAIAQFGLGLLGTQKGQEFARAGYSASNALAGQADALHNVTQQKMQSMNAAGQAMGLQEQLRKFADDDAARKILMGGQPPAGPAGSAPPAAPLAASAPGGNNLYQQLLAKADALEQGGLPQKAQEYRMLAEKYAPKYKGMESVSGPDGKPVLMQTYENQAPTPMAGYGPKPDFKQVDTGGGVGFIDPWSKQQGPAFPKTVSPDSQLSADTARRGQNMVDARSREMHADAQAQAGKPTIVTGADGQLYAVDPRTASGTEVMGADGKPLNKGAKALTESQSNAAAFGMRMKAANEIVSGIEKSGYDVASPLNKLASNPVTNYVATPQAQSLQQAKLNFMTASLRKESGATISPSEFETEDKKYFPQPGDGAEVRKQKAQMRALALRAMSLQAGNNAQTEDTPRRRATDDPLGIR